MKLYKNNNCLGPLLWVVVFVSIFIKTQIIDVKRLETKYRYTIGVITYFDGSAEGCPNVNFSYKINGNSYSQSFRNCGGKYNYIKIGNKYFVKYYINDPMNEDILLDLKISDTLAVPINGWNELPN